MIVSVVQCNFTSVPPTACFDPCCTMQSEAEQSDSMMLKFSLSWSQGPPKHRLLYEMETALDLQRIRNGVQVGGKGKTDVEIILFT